MLRKRSINIINAMQFMVQIVASKYRYKYSIISVKAKERRYMMTGVTRYQLEMAKVGLQLS